VVRSILSRGRRWPIAVDIGSDSIKLFQLGSHGGRLAVQACGLYRCPSGQTDTDAAQKRQQMIAAVRQMLHSGPFAGRQAVSCLSSEQLHIKNIRLPKMPPGDVDKAVQWEAKERFGFEVGPDRLSCLLAGEVRSGNDVLDEMILLAVPKEVIDEHVDLVSQMGLKPLHVDAEPVALFRAYDRLIRRPGDEETVTVILDLGRSASRVLVARGEQIVFIKNIEIGGSHLNESVARKFNLSYQEAVDLRLRTIGVGAASSAESGEAKPAAAPEQRESLEWSVRDAVRGQVESLAREISLCLRYCTVTFRGLRTGKAVVCGGEAYDRALTGMLSEQLGMECTVENPLRGIDIGRTDLAADGRGLFSEWALCAGLALGWTRGSAERMDGASHAESRLSA